MKKIHPVLKYEENIILIFDQLPAYNLNLFTILVIHLTDIHSYRYGTYKLNINIWHEYRNSVAKLQIHSKASRYTCLIGKKLELIVSQHA